MHGSERPPAIRLRLALAAAFLVPVLLDAQTPPASAAGAPIAIVPMDSVSSGQATIVTGALEVTAGKAVITASGSVTSGTRTTEVSLPRRGTLRVCASTTVKLAADTTAPAGGLPGLLMAMDHGVVEMSFAAAPADANADILMTPDFRILIGGPGTSELKVRLGREGDTCIDNGAPGEKSSPSGSSPIANAPYVVVTSLFDGGVYRVLPGQRVMFQHGNLHEVVDHEKEPCGCPPPPSRTDGNEFPLAQSEGIEPTPPPAPASRQSAAGSEPAVPPLVYSGGQQQESPAVAALAPQPATVAPEPPPQPAGTNKKPGVFTRMGRFFRRIFGAE